MASIRFKFTVYLSFGKSLYEREGEIKCISKILFKLHFDRDAFLKSDFARPNSSKAVFLEISQDWI